MLGLMCLHRIDTWIPFSKFFCLRITQHLDEIKLQCGYVVFDSFTYVSHSLEHHTPTQVQRMCKTHNGRERYVEELMRHMPIDSFGSCLHNTNDRTIPRTPRNELIRVVSQYKFYLAIENSNCEDYITEKLNTAIESGAVPVVFAPNNVPDYRKILPMGSFINLADFSSAKKAAAYLLRVASDDELYVVFFLLIFTATTT